MSTSTAALPELSDEYKQQQQQAVLDSDVLYQFELIKEPLPDYGTITIWLIGAALALWVGTLGDWIQFVMVLFFVGAMGTYLYYAGKPNIQQTVTLTEKGIIVSDLELVPDACFAALRYSGYVGVAISVVAVIFVGPMAFVGAGAGLLMSFRMAGVVNRPKMVVTPFIDGISYLDKKRRVATYKNNVTSYFLLPDLTPYQFDENTHFSTRGRYASVYDATPELHAAFTQAVNQVIETKEVEPY
ncbi:MULTISPECIES: hypothetical protein [unclassified Vibrio]|uniref:hypothetical protein n=1 Tax=unclassified Vibrio TaxID=2614977 RepID=UPI001361EDD9|nr:MULTISPECIES: hypothetical protein [unclassified Vibrio]NAW59042.1 hypothetical protein [Vibrio sp. V36_P2S2PM302]NAX25701.1 hypothetical protein [Vibrio sp. V38_P2S17PM301]NAX30885.1 hypothetical protein [Vibrio sp. V37_P2S8PM304]